MIGEIWTHFQFDRREHFQKAAIKQDERTTQQCDDENTLNSDDENSDDENLLNRDDENLLNSDDLVHLIKATTRLIPAISANQMLITLERSLPSAGQEVCTNVLVPFVKTILGQQIPAFLAEDDSLRLRVKEFVTRTLEHFIRQCVGEKRGDSTDWIRAARGCQNPRCADCGAVNEFLATPSRIVGNFACSKPRRFHLHRYFTDMSGDEYTVETIRTSNPNIWQITKRESIYSKEHREWEVRHEQAKVMMHEISQSGPLKEYLGGDFDRIAPCKVENLQQRAPLVDSVNAHATPTSVKETRKRVLDHTSDENEPAKRSRSDAIIIDLT